jgi:hypothetical protein
MSLTMTAVLAAAFAVSSVLRARAEEAAGRAEPIIATATSRIAWFGSHLVVALGGSALLLVVAGGATAVVAALVDVEVAGWSDTLVAAVAYVPAVWVVAAVAAVVVAYVPRAAVGAWGLIAYSTLSALFVTSFGWPGWMQLASPIDHTPAGPLEPFGWTPFVVLLLSGSGAARRGTSSASVGGTSPDLAVMRARPRAGPRTARCSRVLFDAFLLAVGVAVLVLGAELLVKGAAGIATRTGLSPVVIGLTVVAFGTSTPELAVSAQAALRGEADLAIGNVVGSNIANILLVLGISAVVVSGGLVVAQQLVRTDVPIMIGVSIVVTFMALNDMIGRVEGGLLFAGLVVYIVFTVRAARKGSSDEVTAEYDEAIEIEALTSPSPSRRGSCSPGSWRSWSVRSGW